MLNKDVTCGSWSHSSRDLLSSVSIFREQLCPNLSFGEINRLVLFCFVLWCSCVLLSFGEINRRFSAGRLKMEFLNMKPTI